MTTKRATAFEDATRAKMRRKPPPPSSLRSRRRRRVLSRIIIILLFTRHQIATTTQTSKTPPFSRSEKDIFQSTIVRSRHIIIKTRARSSQMLLVACVGVGTKNKTLTFFGGGSRVLKTQTVVMKAVVVCPRGKYLLFLKP